MYYELLRPSFKGSVSNAIDAFEPSIEGEMATVPKETYLETLEWEVLPHPMYSPDVASSDYQLFRSMAHDLAHQHFCSYEEVKKWIDWRKIQKAGQNMKVLLESHDIRYS